MKTPLDRIQVLLRQLYPDEQSETIYHAILGMLKEAAIPPFPSANYFSERNITLITYGDTLSMPEQTSLRTLHNFLNQRLKDLISTVHILPFYPSSSDDGFSVTDYYAVRPDLGVWTDIQDIGREFRMMLDAVINHMSAESDWFRAFLEREPDFQKLFVTANPETDLSKVVRPRISPLLTEFKKTSGGTIHVWTTFSADQVDLEYHTPETLLRVLRVLLFYVKQGAQVLRLDAIAYLWKEVGTTCIHLPQTHEVVQLIRAMLDEVAPHVVLITETNVPHSENITYFGADEFPEAQLVYNFTLPPLLLHALNTGRAKELSDWVNTLRTPRKNTTFFNFTASHDGIGVRPLEGILDSEQIANLVRKVEKSGGKVSYKTNPDGTRSPYELNITYVDAIIDRRAPLELQVKNFLVSQAIMLAMAGVPAIYIHSLIGSHNDFEGVEKLGYPRAINRKKLSATELATELDTKTSFRFRVLQGYAHLIRIRIQCPAFHPEAKQQAFCFNDGHVFVLERSALDDSQHLLCLFNLTSNEHRVTTELQNSVDLLTGESCDSMVMLLPYQVRWLQH